MSSPILTTRSLKSDRPCLNETTTSDDLSTKRRLRSMVKRMGASRNSAKERQSWQVRWWNGSITTATLWFLFGIPFDKNYWLVKSYLQCQKGFSVGYKISLSIYSRRHAATVSLDTTCISVNVYLVFVDIRFFSIEYLSLCKEANPCCSRGAIRAYASWGEAIMFLGVTNLLLHGLSSRVDLFSIECRKTTINWK